MTRLDGGPTVAGLVPSGYDRYLRLLNTIKVSSGNEPEGLQFRLPWSLVCEQLGVDLKPNILWQRDIVSVDPRVTDLHEPVLGTHDEYVSQRVGDILQRHETQDRSWYFASWVGYGVADDDQSVWFPSYYHRSLEMAVFERWNEKTASFALPFIPSSAEGSAPLTSSGSFNAPRGWRPPDQLPMYWWPEGHDWVLGQALYGRSVYLACNTAVAEEVLAMPGIEAIEVNLSDEAEYEE